VTFYQSFAPPLGLHDSPPLALPAVAYPAQTFFGEKSFDFKRATVVWLGYRLSRAQNEKVC